MASAVDALGRQDDNPQERRPVSGGDYAGRTVRSGVDVNSPSDDACAQAYMDQLVAELRRRELLVAAKLPVLTVKDPAVSSQDPDGQQALIRNHEGHGLTWCWVWPSLQPAERGALTPPPEVEPMCPADETIRAADLITNVVRLRDPQLAVSAGDV